MATTITAGNATNGAAISSDNTGILELKSGTGSGTTAMTVSTGQAVTFAQTANLPNTFGFKNRIINGAMVIDQRNAGASVTPTNGAYTLDRWAAFVSQASKITVQQNAGSVTPPAGYTNYLGVTVGASSNVTVGVADYFFINQTIEAFNTADLGWGAAGASTITFSFWVRSSLTGTFGGAIYNGAGNRSYPFTYTISAANTWEQKTVTVAGDTTGTWGTANGAGINIDFSIGAGVNRVGTAGAWAAGNFYSATGATNLISTNSATFYITGVQLEKGSTATSFDYRPYVTELQLCQRYCLVDDNDGGSGPGAYRHFATGYAGSTTSAGQARQLPVSMRAAPSITVSGATQFLLDGNVGVTTTSVTDTGLASRLVARLSVSVASGLTAGYAYHLASDGTNNRRTITYSAEL